MAVTARFFVDEITRRAYNPEHALIKLKPAYNNGEGNKDWAEATPSGSMEMQVNNPRAVEWFAERMSAKSDIAVTFDDVE